uniref:Proteasome subunit beta n=1 Tax=Rhabditophanes sp. KR3021 TaxID=114890 RepID=A0AC35TRU0_9BILA
MDHYDKSSAIPALGHFPREEISTGTTLIAVEFDQGVIVGTDSRTSSGRFIASRCTDKITPVNEHIVCCRSGSAADTQAVTDIVKYRMDLTERIDCQEPTVRSAAWEFKKILFNYRESLSASVIVAGYDEHAGGQIYSIPLGGMVSRQSCTASGSGSTFVHSFLDTNWRAGLGEEEAVEMVKQAVGLATHRDGSSGGIIRIAIIDKNGTRRQIITPLSHRFPVFNNSVTYNWLSEHMEKDTQVVELVDEINEMVVA